MWPFRKRSKETPAVEPSVLDMLLKAQVNQFEAGAKMLTSVMEAADRQAARALGKRRANTAKRRPNGTFAPNSYFGPGRYMSDGSQICRVCANPSDFTLTADEILFHNQGHGQRLLNGS